MKLKKIIDLTHPIKEGMTTFHAYWHPGVEITQIGRHEFEGRETRKITFGSHTGTHMDAPLHFVKGGRSIDKILLKDFIGPVTIVDFTKLKKNEALTIKMLKDIQLEQRVIFKFGWSRYWNSNKFYKGYPYISKEAAKYIVAQGVKLIALDTPSPDDSRIKLEGDIIGTDQDSPIHKIFLQSGIVIVEYLANLDKITDYKNWIMAVMPLMVAGSDGSPVRACLFKYV